MEQSLQPVDAAPSVQLAVRSVDKRKAGCREQGQAGMQGQAEVHVDKLEPTSVSYRFPPDAVGGLQEKLAPIMKEWHPQRGAEKRRPEGSWYTKWVRRRLTATFRT